MASLPWSALGVLSSTGFWAAADQVTNSGGFDYKGVAAIIASSAGMVTAISALVIGWRSNKNTADSNEQRVQLLEDLLLKELKREKEEEE